MVTRKTDAEIDRMHRVGALLARLHDHLAALVSPGVSTGDLEDAAQAFIAAAGGRPSFQGPVAQGYGGFPAALCTSIGSEVVHGLPSHRRRLASGEVLSIDAGIQLEGVHSDAARTTVVGDVTSRPDVVRLLQGTRAALWSGIRAAQVGGRVGDISAAITARAVAHGLSVIGDHDGRVLGGHGIGRSLHEDPFVPNGGRSGRGLRLRPGLVIAIEPMCSLGGPAWYVAEDGWTVQTADGSLAAHEEHTVAITAEGHRVLTATTEEVRRHLGPAGIGGARLVGDPIAGNPGTPAARRRRGA